jgi:hypothetical protein
VQAGPAPPGSSEHTAGPAAAQAAGHSGEHAGGQIEFHEPPASQERPPLPNRREQQSYLRPELRQAPVLTRPIPGHSPDLLADLQLGRIAGQEQADQKEAPQQPTPSDQPHRANEREIEGDTGPWPTI